MYGRSDRLAFGNGWVCCVGGAEENCDRKSRGFDISASEIGGVGGIEE